MKVMVFSNDEAWDMIMEVGGWDEETGEVIEKVWSRCEKAGC